jgi:nucleoside-diphosphate-sugar epimerase
VEDARLYVPAGAGRVAFIDAADIAAVAARVLADPAAFDRRALLLTGREAITFAEAAAVLTTALGRPVRYEPALVPGYCWHLRRRRALPWIQIAVQAVLHVGLRRGDAARVDPTVEQVLGRPPRTLEEYVRDAAARWRA